MAKKITKEQIVKKTMNLILEKGSSETLTIREIAKALNCSHPNIYNYYSGMSDLMWDVLSAILVEMVESVLSKTSMITGEDRFQVFIRQYLQFCFEKLPWYRVVWFDKINGDIPDRVKGTITMPSKKFPEIIMSLIPEINDYDRAIYIGRVINAFIRGEVGVYVTGRIKLNNMEEAILRIEKDILRITRSLIISEFKEGK